MPKKNCWAKTSPHPKAEFHYFKELANTEKMGRYTGVALCGYKSDEVQTGYVEGGVPPVSHSCRECRKKVMAPAGVCGVGERVV